MQERGAAFADQHKDAGGRVFFSDAGRSLIEEDEIELISVGVDIGSSTSHLLFSKIVLERLDTRYVVAERRVLHASRIMLTPYAEKNTIDAKALGDFIQQCHSVAGISPDEIDTGALILTGVAARRSNARAIGEIFAAQAGKFVALSAGDALETLMAAHGSGAVRVSETGAPVINIDVGGGTTKIALCENGHLRSATAIDVGARLVVLDKDGRITRLEPFGARHMADAGITARIGDILTPAECSAIANSMAARVLAVLRGENPQGFLRLPPLVPAAAGYRVIFSGGVAEYIGAQSFDASNRVGFQDDLGPELATALEQSIPSHVEVLPARQRIRATVVGASQFSVQVSGSTIFLDPSDVLPLRNIAVIAPELELGETIDPDLVAVAVKSALVRMDLSDGSRPVAVAIPWQGSAYYARLASLAKGLLTGLETVLAQGHPLVLVIDGDVGGLLGMQIRAEEDFSGSIVSIDGIALSDFDFIDIGAVIRSTGAAPVVVKSLIFPTE